MAKVKHSYLLCAIACLCIVAGLLQGDFYDVLSKAVLVCLECIGLG